MLKRLSDPVAVLHASSKRLMQLWRQLPQPKLATVKRRHNNGSPIMLALSLFFIGIVVAKFIWLGVLRKMGAAEQ